MVYVEGAVLAAQRSTQVLGGRGIREREAVAVQYNLMPALLVQPVLLEPRGAAVP